MLTKALEKYINSLRIKKYREQHNAFVAEGEKIAGELLQSDFSILHIVAAPEWIEKNPESKEKFSSKMIEVDEAGMKKITELKTPSPVLIVASIPEWKVNDEELKTNLSLVLDEIQDPGNMGAVIRIADWFGVPNIFCSSNCADEFNPKTVQASMGSVTRVKVFTADLAELLNKYSSLPSYAAVLNGKNIFTEQLTPNGFILIGNESKGLSPELLQLVKKSVSIPSFGKAESLNAAVAAGIICAQFRMKM